MTPETEVRREDALDADALAFIADSQESAEIAGEGWAYWRLSDKRDSLDRIGPLMLIVLLVGIALMAGGVWIATGEVAAGGLVGVGAGLLGVAATHALKSRDERRALVEKAAALPGFIDKHGNLTPAAVKVARTYSDLLPSLAPSATPHQAIEVAARERRDKQLGAGPAASLTAGASTPNDHEDPPVGEAASPS